MPEDRFGDFGRSSGERPSAAERLAELDDRDPEARGKAPDPRRAARRYTWVVGVAAVIVIVVVGVKTLPNSGLGSSGPPVGGPLPRFAAPDALGSVKGDPNIKQGPGDKSATNHVPACSVRGPGIVNICDLERRPLVLTFIDQGTAPCNAYLDRLQRLAPSFPGVNFAAVISGRSKSEAARLVRQHGWTFPVAVDDNAALLNIYRMPPVCATTTFAHAGGVVRANRTLAQRLSDASLRAEIAATR